jgi:hypothetical protein
MVRLTTNGLLDLIHTTWLFDSCILSGNFFSSAGENGLNIWEANFCFVATGRNVSCLERERYPRTLLEARRTSMFLCIIAYHAFHEYYNSPLTFDTSRLNLNVCPLIHGSLLRSACFSPRHTWQDTIASVEAIEFAA